MIQDIELDQKPTAPVPTRRTSSHHRHHHGHRSHHHARKHLDDPLLQRPRPVHRSKDEAVKMWKTPKEVALSIALGCQKKVSWAMDKYFVLAFMAGIYVGIGGAASLSLASLFASTSPGMAKLIFGLTFPIALVLIILIGGELFTGNTMFFSMGLLQRNITVWSCCLSLFITFFFNWAGCVWFAWFFGIVGEQFTAATAPYVIGLAEHKAHLSWGVALVKAIPANFLVCSGVFISIAAEDIASKIIAMYVCIFTFVVSSYEHCIANMYVISMGYFLGADFNYGFFIYNNLIPVTIGNFIGGGIFLGALTWYYYSFGEDQIAFETAYPPISFNLKKWSFLEFWRMRNNPTCSSVSEQ